jgi:hypothetical protein
LLPAFSLHAQTPNQQTSQIDAAGHSVLPSTPAAGSLTPPAEPTEPVEPVSQVVLPRSFQMPFSARKTPVPRKVRYYLESTVSVRPFAEAMLIAGIPNLTSPPPSPRPPASEGALDAYSGAISTWIHTNTRTLRFHEYRFAAGFATAETREFFSNLVLPIALHQEAAFLPAPVNSNLSDRMVNAAESVVFTLNDEGRRVPNYSKLGGTVIAAVAAKEYYAHALNAPELDSTHFFVRYIGYSLLGDLATNAAHELVRAATEPDLTMYAMHGRATDDSYYPLSAGGKFVYWARSTYAVRNFVTAPLIAGLPNIGTLPEDPRLGNPKTWNGYPSYALAEENYGEGVLSFKENTEEQMRYHLRRLGAGLAESETQQLLQNFLIPIGFSMDPRYVPLGPDHPGGERLGHTLEGLVVTHTDEGKKTVNLPVLLGTVGAAFIAKEVYYPQLGVTRLEANSVLTTTIGLNFAADAVYNVIGEFLRHRGY